MDIYKPRRFQLYEWLPRDFYDQYYPIYSENLWDILFSYQIRYTADRLRQRYGPMIMNDWFWRNENGHQYRGYRPLDCKIGAKLSQHKMGNALDAKFRYKKVEDIRVDILNDPNHMDFKYITCVERDISWLHVDCRKWDKTLNGIKIIYP